MSPARPIEAATAALPAPAVVRRPSFDKACVLAAERTAVLLAEAVAARGTAHLALTGGSAGKALAAALPGALASAGLDGQELGLVHLWFGDERFVPAGDPERNDLLAADLIDAGVPEANVHRLPGPEEVTDVEDAAEHLAADLETAGPQGTVFDIVHLGMGPDAHVCSLFPSHPAALTQRSDVVAVRSSPKPPPERVSMTFDVLHRARCVMVVAGGRGKAEAVRAGLGAPDVVAAPASCARGLATTWYLDDDAASLLEA